MLLSGELEVNKLASICKKKLGEIWKRYLTH